MVRTLGIIEKKLKGEIGERDSENIVLVYLF